MRSYWTRAFSLALTSSDLVYQINLKKPYLFTDAYQFLFANKHHKFLDQKHNHAGHCAIAEEDPDPRGVAHIRFIVFFVALLLVPVHVMVLHIVPVVATLRNHRIGGIMEDQIYVIVL